MLHCVVHVTYFTQKPPVFPKRSYFTHHYLKIHWENLTKKARQLSILNTLILKLVSYQTCIQHCKLGQFFESQEFIGILLLKLIPIFKKPHPIIPSYFSCPNQPPPPSASSATATGVLDFRQSSKNWLPLHESLVLPWHSD